MLDNSKIYGLPAEIFKCYFGDSSNNGISSKYEKVIVVSDPFEAGTIDIQETNLPIVQIKIDITYDQKRLIRAFPYATNSRSSMFGGCFVWSCDSRFRQASNLPVPLHDRFE